MSASGSVGKFGNATLTVTATLSASGGAVVVPEGLIVGAVSGPAIRIQAVPDGPGLAKIVTGASTLSNLAIGVAVVAKSTTGCAVQEKTPTGVSVAHEVVGPTQANIPITGGDI